MDLQSTVHLLQCSSHFRYSVCSELTASYYAVLIVWLYQIEFLSTNAYKPLNLVGGEKYMARKQAF